MSDLLTDDEMVKMVREQADELESCAAAMRDAGDEIDRLRLALETATRENNRVTAQAKVALDLHDALGVRWGDNPYTRIQVLLTAERERDEYALRLRDALDKLPEQMRHCTILLRQCRKGHSWLTATNWVEFSCPTCALETATRERDEAQREAARLMGLVQGWYEGRVRIGSHMTFVDQRFYDSVRCERTGWPGDDEHGDGGPPEE